eukprot:2385370-Pyramimonas_sp.AAC.1
MVSACVLHDLCGEAREQDARTDGATTYQVLLDRADKGGLDAAHDCTASPEASEHLKPDLGDTS